SFMVSFFAPVAGNYARTEAHNGTSTVGTADLVSYRYQALEPPTFLGLTADRWALAAIGTVAVGIALVWWYRRRKRPAALLGPPPGARTRSARGSPSKITKSRSATRIGRCRRPSRRMRSVSSFRSAGRIRSWPWSRLSSTTANRGDGVMRVVGFAWDIDATMRDEGDNLLPNRCQPTWPRPASGAGRCPSARRPASGSIATRRTPRRSGPT